MEQRIFPGIPRLGGVRLYLNQGTRVYYAYATKPDKKGDRRVCESLTQRGSSQVYRRMSDNSLRSYSVWGIHRVVTNVVLKDLPNPAEVSATIEQLQALLDKRFGGIVRVDGIRGHILFTSLYTVDLRASRPHGALTDMSWRVDVFETGQIANLLLKRLLPCYASPFVCQTPGVFGSQHAYEVSSRFGFHWLRTTPISGLAPEDGKLVARQRLVRVEGDLFYGTDHQRRLTADLPMDRRVFI